MIYVGMYAYTFYLRYCLYTLRNANKALSIEYIVGISFSIKTKSMILCVVTSNATGQITLKQDEALKNNILQTIVLKTNTRKDLM